MTKIKLLVTLPLNPKHGAVAGRVFEAKPCLDVEGWWVKGDTGEKIGVLEREAEVIEP